MRKHAVAFAVFSLLIGVGLPVAAGDAKDDAIKKVLAALKGRWTAVSGTRDGKKLTEVKGVTLIYDGAGGASVKMGEKLLFAGKIKIDPTKKPKALDATQTSAGENKGKTFLGIYELKGDLLRVCSSEPAGKARPVEFSSKPGSGHFLRVYRREKKSVEEQRRTRR